MSPLKAAAYLGLLLIVGITLVVGPFAVGLHVFGWILVGVGVLSFIVTMLTWVAGWVAFRRAERATQTTSNRSLQRPHD
jgi:protein-S-isoprenylcysteine O-methyltransferase Ste14